MAERDLDIVVFGATGDTGVAAACFIYFKGKQTQISKWAPAARNLDKLKSDLLDNLTKQPPGPDGIPFEEPIKADSSDYESLVRMCKRTKCVVACAGPFEKYGETVIRACVETGTHYVDITGETHWVEKMEQKYGTAALAKGVTLVSCAGYDSVPPDLTTWLLADSLKTAGEKIQRADVFIGAGGGAMPSGTIETAQEGVNSMKRAFCCGLCACGVPAPPPAVKDDEVEMVEAGNAPPGAAMLEKTTYVPQSEQANLNSNRKYTLLPGWSPLMRCWAMPHFMAPVNVNVVHRTAAQEGYGGLVYRERTYGGNAACYCLCGLIPVLFQSLGIFLFLLFLLLPCCNNVLIKIRDRYNPPLRQKVKDQMFDGFSKTGMVHAVGLANSVNGARAKVKLHSEYDAGIGFTMLSAVAVAASIVKRSGTEDKAKPGFQTAVMALGGHKLKESLEAVGVSIKIDAVEKR